LPQLLRSLLWRNYIALASIRYHLIEVITLPAKAVRLDVLAGRPLPNSGWWNADTVGAQDVDGDVGGVEQAAMSISHDCQS
jgi:hypothetical protein